MRLSLVPMEVSSKNTQLLFLPLFPIRTKTSVALGIGAVMLLLDIDGLLLLRHRSYFTST